MKQRQKHNYNEVISIEEYLTRRQGQKPSKEEKVTKQEKSSVFALTELYV